MGKSKKKLSSINTYLAIALVIVLAVSLYFTLSVPTPQIKPAEPLRELQATLLGSDCSDCANASALIDFLKQQKELNITEVKQFTIKESKELAQKYNITKLQAVIITGNTSGLTTLEVATGITFNLREDALVYSESPAPYYDIAAERVKGRMEIILLEDPTCKNCFNLSQAIAQMKQLGMKISSTRSVGWKTEEGKQLISKYSIGKIPTMIVNAEALEYPIMKETWKGVGSQESDGKLILRLVGPPYVNTTTGKVEGLVDLTYLVDASCPECYNASIYKLLFEQNFNMKFKQDKFVDVSSTKGKLLVKKYSIELVPTAVVSKDAALYPSVVDLWTQILGTQEKDGTLVFRQLPMLKDILGDALVYKNLSSGEVIRPQAEEASDAEVTEPEVEVE